ncbi:MAG: hypothetical protein J5930_08910 [Treponema sp.]|nr:hypothetical protein [Treponema sp.]
MKMIKKIFLTAALVLAAGVSNAFADVKLSDKSISVIEDFLEQKIPFSASDTPQDALDLLDKWIADNQADIDSLTEVEQMVLTNLIDCEIYTYRIQMPNTKKELIKLLSAQTKVAADYLEAHKGEALDKWIYLSAGSVTSVYMALEPLKTAFTYGYSVRDNFQKAVDLDPYFSYGWRNLAQWYFYCPGFLGGSKKIAKEYFQKSMALAKKPSDVYESTILMSQVFYEDKKFEDCTAYLNLAEAFTQGNNCYIQFVRSVNAKGESIFKFHGHKADK